MGHRPSTLTERFWEKVDRRGPDDCWLWVANTFPNGYGQFNRNGINVGAHRFVWELCNGTIPAGMVVMHRCDVRACVNPTHLELGSVRDNVLDKFAKGRAPSQKGESNNQAKLTKNKVRVIRVLVREKLRTRKQIAVALSVSVAAIDNIINEKSWKE